MGMKYHRLCDFEKTFDILWDDRIENGKARLLTALVYRDLSGEPTQMCYFFAFRHKDSNTITVYPLYFRCRGHWCSISRDTNCIDHELDTFSKLKQIFLDNENSAWIRPVVYLNLDDGQEWGTYVAHDILANVKVMKDIPIDKLIVMKIREGLAFYLIPELVKKNLPADKIASDIGLFISSASKIFATTVFLAADFLLQRASEDLDKALKHVLLSNGIHVEEDKEKEEVPGELKELMKELIEELEKLDEEEGEGEEEDEDK